MNVCDSIENKDQDLMLSTLYAAALELILYYGICLSILDLQNQLLIFKVVLFCYWTCDPFVFILFADPLGDAFCTCSTNNIVCDAETRHGEIIGWRLPT